MSNSGDTLKVGEILVREGYLTMDGLNKALQQQQEQNYLSKQKKAYKPFGQICVELNLISSEELQRTLRKHNKQIRLGELLLNQGLIQDKHIEWALDQQKKIKVRFGAILIQGKIFNQNKLFDAISI